LFTIAVPTSDNSVAFIALLPQAKVKKLAALLLFLPKSRSISRQSPMVIGLRQKQRTFLLLQIIQTRNH